MNDETLWGRVWQDYWDRIGSHHATVPLEVPFSEMRTETITVLAAHPTFFAYDNPFVQAIWQAIVREARRRNVPVSTTSPRGRGSPPASGGTVTGGPAGKSTSS